LPASVLGLEPLGSDQTNSAAPRGGLGQIATFDA
jgi:hypothetical protein